MNPRQRMALPLCLAGALLLALGTNLSAAPNKAEPPPPNPYPVERSWPEYFLSLIHI